MTEISNIRVSDLLAAPNADMIFERDSAESFERLRLSIATRIEEAFSIPHRTTSNMARITEEPLGRIRLEDIAGPRYRVIEWLGSGQVIVAGHHMGSRWRSDSGWEHTDHFLVRPRPMRDSPILARITSNGAGDHVRRVFDAVTAEDVNNGFDPVRLAAVIGGSAWRLADLWSAGLPRAQKTITPVDAWEA